MAKVYDLLRKREVKIKGAENSKVYWDNVGELVEKDGKMFVSLHTTPCGPWDGYLTVKERKEKEKPATSEAKN